MTKNRSELHQRAVPKQAPALTTVEESEESIERQLGRIPTLDAGVTKDEAKPKISTATDDVAAPKDSVSGTVTSDETPHVQVETNEERQARLDRQWKQLKIDVADLPGIYARLAKIKLTGRDTSCTLHTWIWMRVVL